MLRIGKMTDYAVVVMTHLARHPDAMQTGAQIAAACGIALPTVSKLLKALTRTGLLQSVRGVAGGYRLARPPAAISVLDIVAALEGPFGLADCSLPGHWDLISGAVRSALRGVTLDRMSAPVHSLHWHEPRPSAAAS